MSDANEVVEETAHHTPNRALVLTARFADGRVFRACGAEASSRHDVEVGAAMERMVGWELRGARL